MIKPLTSLRFLFAFLVFGHHLSFIKAHDSSGLQWFYNYILYDGFIGVSFFFILSGFILAYKYQDALNNRTKSTTEFIATRIARIYPLHFFTLVIAIMLVLWESPVNKSLIPKLVTQLTLTQSFIPISDFYFSFNKTAWSISDEMFFYMLFPILILVIPKLCNGIKICVTIPLIFGLVLAMVLLPINYQHSIFYINPVVRIFDFCIGIILFNIYRKIKSINIKVNYSILELSSIIILATLYLLSGYIQTVYRYSIYYWIPNCILILTFSFQKGLFSKILSNKYLVILGDISFSFYLIHQLVIRYFLILNRKLFFIENIHIVISIMLFLTLVFSYMSYHVIELPANKIVKKFIIEKINPIKLSLTRSYQKIKFKSS